MRGRISLLTAPIVALLATACAMHRSGEQTTSGARQASGGSDTTSRVTELMSHDDARLQTYRIENWRAPDDRTLFVESLDGTRYRAQFLTTCIGLRSAETIGFETRGTSSLDEFSGVRLPDGTRCAFRSFDRLATPERSAEGDEDDSAAEPERR